MEMNANRLGEMLLDAGLIDQFQLESALSMQRNLGGRVGSALVKLGYLPEETIMEFIETQEELSRVSLYDLKISEPIMALLSVARMQELLVIPIDLRSTDNEKLLRVAMTDPTNRKLVDDLQFATGCKVIPVLAAEEEIELALKNNLPKPPPKSETNGDNNLGVNPNLVDLSEVFSEDPRLDRLLDILQKKGVLSALDAERVRFG